MAIDNQTMELIKGIVAQELKNATSLQDAAQGIAKGVTQYVGARYVPLFANPAQWTNDRQYEPLTIVLHQGNSFTSMQYVPIGIDIDTRRSSSTVRRSRNTPRKSRRSKLPKSSKARQSRP